jgi:hypothetical protein
MPHFEPNRTLLWTAKELSGIANKQLTADAWFGSIGWLNSNRDFPAVFSISSSHLGNLAELFSWKLNHHDHRLFYNGTTMLSVWYDNKIMFTASNCFKIVHPMENNAIGIDTSGIEPFISLKATKILTTFDEDDSVALARALGLGSGGTPEEIAYRIARRPFPLRVLNDTNNPNLASGFTLEQMIETLEKQPKAQLVAECTSLQLHTSGNRKKLATRIAKKRLNPQRNEKALIERFLTPTIHTKDETKPPIQQEYANTFNHVDRFNRLMGAVSFNPRVSGKKMLYLIGIIQIAIVQTWVLLNDARMSTEGEEEESFVKSFAVELAQELYKI